MRQIGPTKSRPGTDLLNRFDGRPIRVDHAAQSNRQGDPSLMQRSLGLDSPASQKRSHEWYERGPEEVPKQMTVEKQRWLDKSKTDEYIPSELTYSDCSRLKKYQSRL